MHPANAGEHGADAVASDRRVADTTSVLPEERRIVSRFEAGAGSSSAHTPPNLNSPMNRPSHVALGRWLLSPSNPRSQALRAVEGGRMADHLPLALRIGESIADLISIGKIEAVAGSGP